MSIIKMVMVFRSMRIPMSSQYLKLEKANWKVNPSVEAQEYLQRTVFSALECLNYWEKNNDQIRGNSVKRLYSTRRNKQERRSLEDRDKVQILGAMELPNGDVKWIIYVVCRKLSGL